MSVTRQVLCAVIIKFLCVGIGITFTFPSSTMTLFKGESTPLHRPMTDRELALFGSLSSIGALIANPAAGFLLDIIGRKYCATMFSLVNVFAWVMTIASNRVEVLLTAVFISGVGGAAFLVVPLYVSEFCQDSIRGAMTSGSMVFYCFGMIISYAVGGYMEYYPMLYVSLSIAVIGTSLMMFLKESPIYLMKRGRVQEAAKAVAFYRAADINSKIVHQEIENIRRILDAGNFNEPASVEEKEKLRPIGIDAAPKLSLFQFLKKSYSTRRALFVAIVLMSAVVFQGFAVVQVYAEPLFSEAIPTMSATISSILFSVVTLLAGFLAAYLTEASGRRPLMLYSSIGAGVCCVLLGSQIHKQWAPHAVTAVIMYAFCVVYTLGAGSTPFVLCAELFLPEVKSIVYMLVIEWAWLCNFIMLFLFNPLLAVIGLGPVFYVFAAVCFATAVFTYYFLPETKGLPVDVIQTLFSKSKSLALMNK